jgi:glycosyltransferase involved in cell wall biosynthesis
MRYAWTFHDEYLGAGSLKQRLARPVLAALRTWDRSVSDRVTRFVAISEHVRDRIARFYGREADVVYPPADIDFYTPGPGVSDGEAFDLVVSALVPYKRVDLAVRACTRLGRRLKVVGTGTESSALRAVAGPGIEFLGWRSDEEIRALYRSARMLLFPGEEDFGIVPVEAQACGCPVVALGRGGALETVARGTSGLFFADQIEPALIDAIEAADATPWNPGAIRANATRFSPQAFVDGLAHSLAQCRG